MNFDYLNSIPDREWNVGADGHLRRTFPVVELCRSLGIDPSPEWEVRFPRQWAAALLSPLAVFDARTHGGELPAGRSGRGAARKNRCVLSAVVCVARRGCARCSARQVRRSASH